MIGPNYRSRVSSKPKNQSRLSQGARQDDKNSLRFTILAARITPILETGHSARLRYWAVPARRTTAYQLFYTMALLPILEYPDPRLRTQASEVTEVDDSLRQLIDDMFETMYDAPGIGLAATQVNVHKRLIVIDISENRSQPLVLINPRVRELEGHISHEEGCLSVPGQYESVERVEHIEVTALDRNGQEFTFNTAGLLSVCIQHECDHLEGKLFVDYISSLKRQRIRKKLLKSQRQRA